jgi:4-amino-4-deoxy-L-arabinose transferase-like glycosyltransferase
VITRLVGFSLVVAGAGFLLISGSGKFRQRLLQSLLFLFIAIVPILIWLFQSSSTGDGTLNRSFAFHPMSVDLIKGYFFFLGDWIQIHRLIPGRYRLSIAIFLVIAGPFMYAWQWIKENRRLRTFSLKPRDPIILLALIYIVSYMTTLYLNTTFIDASTTAYAPERYVTSIYPVFVIVILLTYFRVLELVGRKRLVLIALTLLVTSNLLLQGASTLQEILQNKIPLGYTDFIQEHPAFIAVVRQNVRNHVIYTNNPELTYAISGIGAYILPFRINTGTALENPNYEEDVLRMENDLKQGARIVHYGEKDAEQALLYDSLDLWTIAEFPEGGIYGVR